MKNFILSSCLLTLVLGSACTNQPTADMIIHNGPIYTVADQETVEAVVVIDDRIAFVGSTDEAMDWQGTETTVIDLKGQTMIPGLIESHGHLMGLGYNELNLDLMKVKSYEEMVEKVKEAVDKAEPGEWILGRGWHQDKWDSIPANAVKGFQRHELLSEVSPNNPVYLRHASGHAGMANSKAMEIAGVNQLSKEYQEVEVVGGEVIRDELGNPTGVFNETAQRLIGKHIPQTTEEKDRKALDLAIKACYRNGITSFHDAGQGRSAIDLYKNYQENDMLNLRVYVMLTGTDPALVNEYLESGMVIDSIDHMLTIRSIKLNCDGALGSRGAWLLEEYTDMPGVHGHETLPMETVTTVSDRALAKGFQVCAHAIGDRANREILDRYETAFKKNPTDDHRFRIEHAQHLHPDDIPRFGELGVIPAMQAVHLSSDRPWAIDRLGQERIENGAYMWQALLQSGAKVINGTDVPVEPVDPLASFYASVSRKTLKGLPAGGYEPAQRMTRKQALRSYTLDAAFGEFAEEQKGSIEVGKLADFTVLSKNIMTIEDTEILDTEIAMTVLGGQVVYKLE
jgi:predicted amidohydrolase YtcJ